MAPSTRNPLPKRAKKAVAKKAVAKKAVAKKAVAKKAVAKKAVAKKDVAAGVSIERLQQRISELEAGALEVEQNLLTARVEAETKGYELSLVRHDHAKTVRARDAYADKLARLEAHAKTLEARVVEAEQKLEDESRRRRAAEDRAAARDRAASVLAQELASARGQIEKFATEASQVPSLRGHLAVYEEATAQAGAELGVLDDEVEKLRRRVAELETEMGIGDLAEDGPAVRSS